MPICHEKNLHNGGIVDSVGKLLQLNCADFKRATEVFQVVGRACVEGVRVIYAFLRCFHVIGTKPYTV